MIRRIDTWLLARVYQPVVDATQKQPAWLARQCVLAWGLANIIGAFIFERPAWILVLALAAAAVLTAATYAPPLLAGSTNLWFRALLLVFTALDVVMWATDTTPARWALSTVLDTAFTSFYYFAACRPPKPRVPRARLAYGGMA